MRIYRGDAKCAGCGVSGKDKPRWHKDKLCDDCSQIMKLGKGVLADYSGGFTLFRFHPYYLNEVTLSRPKTEDELELELAITKQNTQYVNKQVNLDFAESPVYLSDINNKEGSSTELSNAFKDLLKTMDCGIKQSYDQQLYEKEAYSKMSITLQNNTATAVVKFLKSLAKYSYRIKSDAEAKGKSLLVQMSEGGLKLGDLNKNLK
jgi:hypothetical protein